MSKTQLAKIESILATALSRKVVDEVGRETGQSKRLRVVTPHRLFLTLIGALGGGKIESIADLLREFNRRFDCETAYKAFYNRLARSSFPEFMCEMLCRLLGELSLQTLRPEPGSPLSEFKDIVIQDGSSFALKDALKDLFPGRFTKHGAAAVELHATYSGFEDNVIAISLAPDTDPERRFLPEPEELAGRLLLADRGYPSLDYFERLGTAGASFVVRLLRTYDPSVTACFAKGRLRRLPKPVRMSRFLAQNQNRVLDLDVEFKRGEQTIRLRIVVLPGKEKWMTRLATNLDRERFPLDLVGKLYRLRWQIELCFKEWKSYANLHRFNTANEHIAEGLIWASICAAVLKRFLAHATQLISGGVAISTRRVAMCARLVIDDIFTALATDGRRLRAAVASALDFLLANARRAHPDRDRKSGRLQAGLEPFLARR